MARIAFWHFGSIPKDNTILVTCNKAYPSQLGSSKRQSIVISNQNKINAN